MPIGIQNPRAWGRLVDAFTIRGRHRLLLDEIVVPVVLIEDLSDKPGPQQEATFTMFAPAVVANPLTLLLENSSEGSIFHIDEVTFNCADATAVVEMRLTVTPPAAAAPGGFANKTWNDNTQTPVVSGTMFADTGAFVGPRVWNGSILADVPIRTSPKLVLRPGQLLAITNTTDNRDLSAVINARIVPIAIA